MHQVLNPWLPGLLFTNVKHRLLIMALKQYVDNFCLPVLEKSGKSQGISCGLESGHPAISFVKLVVTFIPTVIRDSSLYFFVSQFTSFLNL